jgi:hypothetical protein
MTTILWCSALPSLKTRRLLPRGSVASNSESCVVRGRDVETYRHRRRPPADRRDTVDLLVARLPVDTLVVSGGASDPDTWAEEAASKQGLATKIFRPDLAGAESRGQITRRYHARKRHIVDAADEVFALVAPDRKGGIEDTIRRRQRKGITITIL